MDCCYGNNFIYFYLLKDSISYLSVISSFCNIVFVRLEYQGDTKMFSSILELNNLSVMYSQKCGGFFFFFHLSQTNMIWDLCSCVVLLLYKSYCIWLDRLLYYLFDFLKLMGYPLQRHWNNFHRKKMFSQVIQELMNLAYSKSW